MPSTHQQLLYHIVFSTKNRKPYLQNEQFRTDLFAYMAGITKNLDGFALEIGGWVDHVHLLVRIPAKVAVSDFVGRLKANSSKHVNETSDSLHKFGWQEGFGAFTVSVSQKDAVAEYIKTQAEHHSRESFQEEYVRLLKCHGVDYDARYVFD
ncbi:IS200/IS605 family transposase [Adhaeretor mobilis]|uniref:Transposase IS200 like protein n=1 Tax=Adhaeretor mobilis TaxID=1930276 RepID=A0A517MYF0_9BACT|nr:IS200/IS605 family transposase [Adhaeretor mobilis]QDS99886.1 Transposase IS200 like protein [Adhaeretor mobilis]